MSLLLQALQKAAKNRQDGEEDGAVSPGGSAELSLEPVGEPEIGEEVASPPAASPAQASTVMRAAETPRYTAIDWMRDHYMITFIGAAILFSIGYGSYVYVQIANPEFLRGSPPAPASAPMQMAAAPVPPVNDSTAKISGMPDEIGSTPDRASKPSPAPDRASAAPAGAADDMPRSAGADTPPRPRAPARSARTAAATPAPPADPAGNAANAAVVEDGVEVIEIPASPAIATAPRSRPAREDISVRQQPSSVPPVSAALLAAYQALQQGDYAKSRQLYVEVLAEEPRNIDALLGMAVIAWKQGRIDEAGRHYSRVLELDPRNIHAQAGLIAMLGSADPVAAESRLKQLIAREPSGFLYFTLGNLYAEQGQWPLAQQAYFQAYQFQPENPDYAFNLAVGLEHLGQATLALDYYRKALDLSFKKGRANFDQGLAIERVGRLSARVQ